MKELTRAEEQIMQVLWELEKAFVKEILEKLPAPAPAYNTVSTIVRILEQKGFVSHTGFGKSHQYYPLISKEEYSRQTLKNLVTNYFEGSFKEMVSFFAREKKLSLGELDEILQEIKKQKKKKP